MLRLSWKFIAGAYLLLAMLAYTTLGERTFVRLYERAALVLAPSPERAFAYGNRHFDAKHPDAYDIDHAQVLFEKAHKLNSELPGLQHQRARIAFLEADYPRALAYIDEAIRDEPTSISSYYVRGLIKGFAGDYGGAASDFETYLASDPSNWAATNDYAWVLLKDDRPEEAHAALERGLVFWPDNPWLLNAQAIALFEQGESGRAAEAAYRAGNAVQTVTEVDWLNAYPGNDPLIAGEGVRAFRAAIAANIHSIVTSILEEQKSVQ